MRFSRKLLVILSRLLLCLFVKARDSHDNGETDWQEIENALMIEGNALVDARWKFVTNVSEENAVALAEALARSWKIHIGPFMQNLDDGTEVEIDVHDNLKHVANVSLLWSQMEIMHSTVVTDRCDVSLLDLNDLMATSTNYEKLEYYWRTWHDSVGKLMRKKYVDYLSLHKLNEHIIKKYFSTTLISTEIKQYISEGYTEEDFRNDVDNVWLKVKPLYEQLYTYVRRVLATKVYKDRVKKYGRLPSHVLGDVETKSWRNIAKLVMPYENAPSIDSTPALTQKRFDVREMFKLAESFFTGLGLEPMNDAFWANSMFEKPEDRDVVCHASTMDFLFNPGNDTTSREDYRIKMCARIKHEDLMTAIREMGHVEYLMSYKNQEFFYRTAANPGFNKAIGDSLGLAFSTPSHLKSSGLLLPESDNRSKTEPLFDDLPPLPKGITEQELNYLLTQALDKIATIPFVLVVVKWRWSVLNDEVDAESLNTFWWNLRREFQGIGPPVARTEEDFDPGSVYQIIADEEPTRNYVAAIIQFQLYEGLCKTFDHFQSDNPEMFLFKCDFSNNQDVGALLKEMMEAGSSEPWPDLLEHVTGYREMDASSLLTYFNPLYEWLVKANENQCLGWETNCVEIAADYMAHQHEQIASELEYYSAVADWNYQTNLTEDNANNMTKWTKEAAFFSSHSLEEYLTQFDYEDFTDEFLKRQFHLLVSQETTALEESDLVQLIAVVNSMTEHYSTTKICPYKKPKCAPDEMVSRDVLETIVGSSTNFHELVYIWRQWRDAASKPLRPIYEEYVQLSKKAVKNMGLKDAALPWLLNYETENFEEDIENLLLQIRPLYQKIHAYTRMKLRNRYKKGVIPNDDAPIPAVVLGDLDGQTWGNLYDILLPYGDILKNDPNTEMEQNWNVTLMFRVAEEFFTSLGLEPMPTSYGPESMLEKPMDREVNCHPSSWDFGNGKDYRITMCAGVSMDNMLTIVHELGHIQYYQQYKHLPTAFRQSANPGFHEAIGDTIALSFATPTHLKRIGILRDYQPSKEADLNFLMKIALDTVVFLPSAYVIDRWRWGVLRDEFPPSQWTYQWLKLTEEHQGISPPVMRDESDFDPGAKFHVVADEDYIGYFVATILQFQIHKALCLASGRYDPEDPDRPLYRCDIYGSSEAGDVLRNIMQAGASRPWRETLANATGMNRLDASAMLEYFQLLDSYLTEQLELANETIGWRSTFTDFYKEDNNLGKKFYVGIVLTFVAALFFLTALVCHFRKKKSWASKRRNVRKKFDPENEFMLTEMMQR